MSDKPFARIVKMPDGTSHVIIGDYQSEYYENDSEDVFSDAYKINTAHQAALTAERKRVLEMVFDLDGFKPTLHEMFGVAHDNPEMAEAYQRVGKVADGIRGQLKIEIRALLSRLEGEGGKQ